MYCIQRTIRNFMIGKTWQWWQLWTKIKPNLRSAKFAEIKVTFIFDNIQGILDIHVLEIRDFTTLRFLKPWMCKVCRNQVTLITIRTIVYYEICIERTSIMKSY